MRGSKPAVLEARKAAAAAATAAATSSIYNNTVDGFIKSERRRRRRRQWNHAGREREGEEFPGPLNTFYANNKQIA